MSNSPKNKKHNNIKKTGKISPESRKRFRNKLVEKKKKEDTRRKLGLPKTQGYIGGKSQSKLKKECKIICDKHLKLFLKQIDKKHKKAFKRGFNKTCKISCLKKANSVVNKTRKNQRGGMPTIITNLGHGIGYSVSNFINTLNGVPAPTNPLPFMGHFPI